MAEKEKIMTVTLESAVEDANSYREGVRLELPAEPGGIQDALDKARVGTGQPYKIIDCRSAQRDALTFLPENPRLEELDLLARRIDGLSEYERHAFDGCVKMLNSPSMKDLINLTYSLDDVHVVQATDDYALGKFYADNGFLSVLEDLLPEQQEALFELLDFDKIGRKQREAEGGVFLGEYYITRESAALKEVYTGTFLNDSPKPYVFRLNLVRLTAGMRLPPVDKPGVKLELPAGEREIENALRQLGVKSLSCCVFTRCDTPIPALRQAFDCSADIGQLNELAHRLREVEQAGELAKFKAAFEVEGCTDVGQTLELAQNLDAYEFHPELTPEAYGEEILRRHSLDTSDHAFALFDFGDYGERMMHRDGLALTDYGAIRRVGPEPELAQAEQGLCLQ